MSLEIRIEPDNKKIVVLSHYASNVPEKDAKDGEIEVLSTLPILNTKLMAILIKFTSILKYNILSFANYIIALYCAEKCNFSGHSQNERKNILFKFSLTNLQTILYCLGFFHISNFLYFKETNDLGTLINDLKIKKIN